MGVGESITIGCVVVVFTKYLRSYSMFLRGRVGEGKVGWGGDRNG